ncbi:hypothetical protein THAOC_33268, partial [Thalassiosira oceanica]
DGNLASGHPSVLPTGAAYALSNALFIQSSDRSVSPVKSHPWLLQERIAPPPSPGSNQRVAPTKKGGNWSLGLRPLLAHTSIENRPVHNIGGDGLSSHLNVVVLPLRVRHPLMGSGKGIIWGRRARTEAHGETDIMVQKDDPPSGQRVILLVKRAILSHNYVLAQGV